MCEMHDFAGNGAAALRKYLIINKLQNTLHLWPVLKGSNVQCRKISV